MVERRRARVSAPLAGCTLKRYDTQTGTANPLIPHALQEQLE